jgi:hypothetical protein
VVNQSVLYEREGELSLQDALPAQPGVPNLPGGGGIRTLVPVGL